MAEVSIKYQATETVVDMEDEDIALPTGNVALDPSTPAPIPSTTASGTSVTDNKPSSESVNDTQMDASAPASSEVPPVKTEPPPKKRPRLDVSAITNVTSRGSGGERRKGKSIFGMVLGTLNKAKIEDKERMASEAAKKRQSIDARLQAKLAREQSIVRQQDESKKDRLAATRKEEDLSVKDGILKHRYAVLPQLSNFLLTTDTIPRDIDDIPNTSLSGALAHPPPTTHPTALYYLPKILTPSQEAFIAARRKQAETRVREEKEEWDTERRKGLESVRELREKSAAAHKSFLEAQKSTIVEDGAPSTDKPPSAVVVAGESVDVDMESGEKGGNGVKENGVAPEGASVPVPASTNAADVMEQDEDDAVEY